MLVWPGVFLLFFFFFSSRRRHTRCLSDWSSDVCSSDLHWPTDRALPEIYFDPRSLSIDAKQRAVLHAKCIVVDGQTAFVSSANFTEAAQERNIEVGVLVRSQIIAERLTTFFAALISTGAVKRVL